MQRFSKTIHKNKDAKVLKYHYKNTLTKRKQIVVYLLYSIYTTIFTKTIHKNKDAKVLKKPYTKLYTTKVLKKPYTTKVL